MKWATRHIEHQTIFATTVEHSLLSEDMVLPPLIDAWRCFCAEVAPLHNNFAWDTVRVEFWTESGKVVLHPHRPGGTRDKIVAVVEIFSPCLRDFACERIHSEIPIEKVEQEVGVVEMRLAGWIAAAARQANIAAVLGRPSINLIFCMPNDDEAFQEATIQARGSR